MATTFVVEDGTGLSTANALISVAEADQIIENYGDDSTWSGSTDSVKQNAIREATRYMNVHYIWKGYRTVDGQALQWPREWVYDDEDVYVDNDTIPEKVKEACAYLALQVVSGETLLEDFTNAAKVKRTKEVIGPLAEEIVYVHGEDPGTDYQTADQLVSPYTEGGSVTTHLHRA